MPRTLLTILFFTTSGCGVDSVIPAPTPPTSGARPGITRPTPGASIPDQGSANRGEQPISLQPQIDSLEWNLTSLPDAEELETVWGTQDGGIYTAGSLGTLFHSIDGVSWKKVDQVPNTWASSVWMDDAQTLWLVGGYQGPPLSPEAPIAHYHPATRTWDLQRDGAWIYQIRGNGDIMYLAGNGDVFGSVNAGASWKPSPLPHDLSYSSIWMGHHVIFITAFGATSGKPILAKSPDDGATWTLADLPANKPVTSICSLSASDFYIAGNAGLILHSSDGGESWKVEPTPTTDRLWTTWCFPPGDVFAAGDGGTVIHKKGAGGWRLVPTPTHSDLRALWGSADRLFAVGGSGVVLTTKLP